MGGAGVKRKAQNLALSFFEGGFSNSRTKSTNLYTLKKNYGLWPSKLNFRA
jgi:hypothetical protein